MLNVACWAPSDARRGFQPLTHVDWHKLETTTNCFFLRSVEGLVTEFNQAQALSSVSLDADPSLTDFSNYYRSLSADATTRPAPSDCLLRHRPTP